MDTLINMLISGNVNTPLGNDINLAPKVKLRDLLADAQTKARRDLYLWDSQYGDMIQESHARWNQERFDTMCWVKPIDRWQCSYEPVGLSVLYLRDLPMGLIWKPYRKSSERFIFFDKNRELAFLDAIRSCNDLVVEPSQYLGEDFMDIDIPLVSKRQF